MRRALLVAGLLAVSSASCGGAEQPIAPPACAHGPDLSQTASAVIAPSAGFVLVSSVVAASDGKTFLATWTTSEASAVAQGHVVVAHQGPNGITASGPTDAPAGGQAVFDGEEFLVVGRTSGPVIPGEPGSISLQRFRLDGSAASGPETIDSTPDVVDVSSAAWTARGIAVAWYSPGAPTGHVQLVGPDGAIRHDLALDTLFVDPATGLEGSNGPAVAAFGDQLVAACGQTVSTLDWLGGASQTSQTKFTVSVPEKAGFPTVFETGGKLMIWGFHSDSLGLYAGTPGGSFTLVRPVSPSAITQQSDGCGGAVTLSNANQTIEVAADTSPGRVVRLGTALLSAGDVAAMTRTSTGYAVAWAAADGIHLATLAWL